MLLNVVGGGHEFPSKGVFCCGCRLSSKKMSFYSLLFELQIILADMTCSNWRILWTLRNKDTARQVERHETPHVNSWKSDIKYLSHKPKWKGQTIYPSFFFTWTSCSVFDVWNIHYRRVNTWIDLIGFFLGRKPPVKVFVGDWPVSEAHPNISWVKLSMMFNMCSLFITLFGDLWRLADSRWPESNFFLAVQKEQPNLCWDALFSP